jgi:hypothetical protein
LFGWDGQGAQGLPGTLCQKVLFCFYPLFLPVVSASKVQSRSRGVQRQGQVGRWADRQIVVEELDTHCRPQATDRRPEGGGLSSTSGLRHLPTAKSGEQSENVYENKGQGQNVEELRSRGVEKWGARPDRESSLGPRRPEDADGSSTSGVLHFSTAKWGEQSENVYENKGRAQKVAGPLTRLATLATLSPGKRAVDDGRSQYTKIAGTNLRSR